MRRLAAICLLGLGLLGGCGGQPDPTPTAATLSEEGDAHAKRGDWLFAADTYRRAYAQVDPVPEQAAERADLALRRGRALLRANESTPGLLWLERALRHAPARYEIHYDVARAYDGEHPDLVDPTYAGLRFAAFLEAWEEAGEPAALAGLATHAKARIEALGAR